MLEFAKDLGFATFAFMNDQAALLRQVRKDLDLFREIIQDSSQTMRKEDHTQFPIFVLSMHPFPAATPLVDSQEANTQFSLFASTTEDFIRLGLIPVEKAKKFLASYKPVDAFMCLFVVPENPQEAHFIFLPYGS